MAWLARNSPASLAASERARTPSPAPTTKAAIESRTPPRGGSTKSARLSPPGLGWRGNLKTCAGSSFPDSYSTRFSPSGSASKKRHTARTRIHAEASSCSEATSDCSLAALASPSSSRRVKLPRSPRCLP